MRVVLCAHKLGSPVMGGDRARAQLQAAFEEAGAQVELATYDTMPRGRDVHVFESPVTADQIARADGRVSLILRHGDCQMAFLAPELINQPCVHLVTPTEWAYQRLGWRVDSHIVQWMALERPFVLSTVPRGQKVLHVRAFDFQKDTPLAIQVAELVPEKQFVFRVQEGATIRAVPPNVTLLPATTSQDELWADVGCLLVTSRWETFCMAAYEAMARGIPVVSHACLGAITEWSLLSDTVRLGTNPSALASAVLCDLEPDPVGRQAIHNHALIVHSQARSQFQSLLDVIRSDLTA